MINNKKYLILFLNINKNFIHYKLNIVDLHEKLKNKIYD